MSKVHRTEATLVKSYTQLQVKKLDLDFAVDPLFRKTRAEFDEGGATGLLLNHLGVDSKMRVVFDSGDSKITTEGDEDDEEELNQPIELDHIRGTFLLCPRAIVNILTRSSNSESPPSPRNPRRAVYRPTSSRFPLLLRP